MTDANAPATKFHRAALGHLAPLRARRDTVQAVTATWTPNAAQDAAEEPTAPPTEGTE